MIPSGRRRIKLPRLPPLLRLGVALSATLLAVAGLAGLVGLAACLPALAGEGDAPVTTQTRALDLAAVTTVDLAGSLDVRVTVDPDAAPSLTVTAEPRLLAQIVTEVNGTALRVTTEGSFTTRRPTRVDVTLPALSRAALSGSGGLDVAGTCRADAVDADLVGSGKLIFADVEAATFRATLSGSGRLRVAGKAGRLSLKIAGSGDADADGLAAGDARVSISGSGNARVRATESADLTIAGSGNVACAGHPKTVKQHVAGSGDVTIR